ncbi:MAG: hypothetical protein U0996_27160 [Planctomycetaceae bacterium]
MVIISYAAKPQTGGTVVASASIGKTFSVICIHIPLTLWQRSAMSFSSKRITSGTRRTIWVVLCLSSCVGGVALLLSQFVHDGRERSIDRMWRVREALKACLDEQGEADNYFHDSMVQGSGDAPTISWRLKLLPYLGYGGDAVHQSVTELFDTNRPWDVPRNISSALAKTGLGRTYCCVGEASTDTCVFAVVSDESDCQPFATRQIGDYQRLGVMVIETKPQGIHWLQPADIVISGNPQDSAAAINVPLTVICHQDHELLVLLSDWSIWRVDAEDAAVFGSQVMSNGAILVKDLNLVAKKLDP